MNDSTPKETNVNVHAGNCETCGAWSTDLNRLVKIDRNGSQRFVSGFICPTCRSAK